jgi:hypothetical protein
MIQKRKLTLECSRQETRNSDNSLRLIFIALVPAKVQILSPHKIWLADAELHWKRRGLCLSKDKSHDSQDIGD